MSLDPITINDAMNVRSGSRSLSRTQVGGAVVIYDLDDVPAWLQPILDARDEDGDPSDAIRVLDPGEQRNVRDQRVVVEYRKGSSITGEPT